MSIKEQIKASGLFQYQVGRAIGVNETTISRWLRYENDLDKDKIDRIEKAIKELTNK